MRARRLAALALGSALLLACGEDPLPKLRAEREAVLDGTRPKAEFWTEVERKGSLAKEKRGLDAEIAQLQAQATALGAERDQLAASLAQSQDVNAQTAAALAGNRQELARIEGEVAKREATLAGFDTRRAAEDTP